MEDLDAFYSGVKLACDVYGVDIVGGDTSASLTGLCISITCIGEGESGRVCLPGWREGNGFDMRFGVTLERLIWACSCWSVKSGFLGEKKILLLISQEKSICWSGS